MYTVVVADDEEELRKAIIRKVQWEEIGFQVVGEADNGIEALELVEKLEPDLLLTDIRMPFVSGIELARRVREVRPTTHIAFLSGFDDFTYAQQAIQYNIISYMLKPITITDLTNELTRIKEKIDKRFEEFLDRSDEQKESLGTGTSEFLIPLLLDGYYMDDGENREAQLQRQAVECGVLKDQNNDFRYVVLVATVTDQDGVNRTNRNSVHSMNLILKKYVKYESFYADGRVVSLIMATPATFERFMHILVEDVIQSTERILGMHCSMGVSRQVSGLSLCHEAYREAMNAVSYSRRTDSSVHYIADEERSEEFGTEEILHSVSEIENIIRSGSKEELSSYLQEMFHQIQTQNISRLKVNYLLIQLTSAVCKIVYAVADGEVLQNLEEDSLIRGMSFFDGSFPEMEDRFLSFCMKTKDMIVEQKKKSSMVLCEQTLALIEAEYSDPDLSLVGISNRISVSPNYLSALMKKHMGTTFIDLLTKKRIETARELLLCTAMKIREIAEKCGYSDQHYFSYCFKKFYGISPNMLRQQREEQGGATTMMEV